MQLLQFKCNERQRRAIHEREYWKYISNLRRQSCSAQMSHLSIEHIRESDRFRMGTSLHRQKQHERIQRENDLLSKRISQAGGQLMSKEQCEKDWQRHVEMMKKTSNYPENIDRFVSNQKRRLTDGLFTKVLRLCVETRDVRRHHKNE